jgi:hypothetical protein
VAKWRAERCRYAILVQNANKAQEMRGGWDFATGTEANDVAFFVGRGLHPVQEDHDRWLIRFYEFAQVSVPSFWTGDRYPILRCAVWASTLRDSSISRCQSPLLPWQSSPSRKRSAAWRHNSRYLSLAWKS